MRWVTRAQAITSASMAACDDELDSPGQQHFACDLFGFKRSMGGRNFGGRKHFANMRSQLEGVGINDRLGQAC